MVVIEIEPWGSLKSSGIVRIGPEQCNHSTIQNLSSEVAEMPSEMGLLD